MKPPRNKGNVVVENRNSVITLGRVPPQQRQSRNLTAISDYLGIGLASWVIQDGNYGDFVSGKHAAFALEFFAVTLLVTIEPPIGERPALNHLDGSQYEAVGKVVYVGADWWVLDVGFLAYSMTPLPPNAQLGGWIEGEICIEIDHFAYFETLAKEADAPALIFDWKIEKIKIQTAPWIEVRPNSWQRDHAQNGWQEIDMTAAWHDDEGHAAYILLCTKLDSPARRTRQSFAPT